MGFLLIGSALLGSILGLFWAKDRVRRPWLARLAYSELTMRLTVIACALIVIGVLVTLDRLFG